MKEELLDVLACPQDASGLRLEKPELSEREVKSGILRCERGHSYQVVRYIPRFVPSDLYVRNFSVQWLTHRNTQFDSHTGAPNTANSFNLKTGFSGADLKGRLVLDAGCGSGRFMDVASAMGATVVGLDLSNAVDAARQMLGSNGKTHLVQGDIMKPPFKQASFDLVYSIGVLHHTTNTKKAFMSLGPLLKHGGRIAIWVYPDGGPSFKAMNLVGEFYRKGASIMSLAALYRVSEKLAGLPIPRVLLGGTDTDPTKTASQGYLHPRQVMFLAFPFLSLGTTYDWRVLETFDYLAPKYQFKHTWEEVSGWFKEAGMTDVKPLAIAVSYSGKRP